MLDALNTKVAFHRTQLPLNVVSRLNDSFCWQGIKFTSVKERYYEAEEASLKDSELGGLYLKFGRGQYANFYLSNSLHKMCYEGINHTDFTKNQLEASIDHISSKLEILPNEFLLQGKIEFSVNIPVSDANGIIANCVSYKNTPMENMKRGHINYGKKAFLSKYSIKLYNPLKKLKMENPELFKASNFSDDNKLLRYEITIQVAYVQKQWGIAVNTLQSLTNDTILTQIGKRLAQSANGLFFKPIFPIDIKPQDEQKYLYFIHTPKARLAHFRKHNHKTYMRHRAVYNSLKKQYGQPYNLFDLISEKWQFLQKD